MAGNWDIRRLYMYLVSFATLMMMIVGTVMFVQGAINLIYPRPDVYPDLKMRYSEMAPKDPKVTEAEIQKQIAQEQAQQRYYEVRSMVNSLVLVGVALPVYLYHWRKIQRSES